MNGRKSCSPIGVGTINTSKGEQRIITILKCANENFEREYSFKDLKSLRHKPLRFDFVLMNVAGIPRAVIEFDGEQHFLYNGFFSKSEQDFKYKQESDVRKNEYCLARGIPLYRIPYYDYPRLTDYRSLFRPEYLVRSKWHNYLIRNKIIADNKAP